MIEITGVLEDSPAQRARIRAGDKLISINGRVIHDVLDYRFAAAEERLTVELEREGKVKRARVRKERYDDLGLCFESALMDSRKSCGNHCVFCFIDQNPKGMRESVYFKDDDARLSFLQGSYITLTNLTEEDVDRIIEMRLSVNISVHTTDPALRAKMLGNVRAGDSLRHLYRLAEAGVPINCQIVLCPGWNDGEALHKTLADLFSLVPAVQSIAVVPVGLTRHRDKLCRLEPFTKETARAAVEQIEAVARWSLGENGSRIVYASDELYLLAGLPIPPAEAYEDYPQFENGVGMLRALTDEFLDALENAEYAGGERAVTIATGQAAAPFLSELAGQARKKFPPISCRVRAIRNDFYGESVTVAGLLTGGDLLAQLRGEPLGDVLLLTDACLRRDDLFLDDMSREELSAALGVRVAAVPCDGAKLLEAILRG